MTISRTAPTAQPIYPILQLGKETYALYLFIYKAIMILYSYFSALSSLISGNIILYCKCLTGLSYRWLLNEFPVFLPTDSRRFVSQVTGNLYIARTEAQDEAGYSCLTTSHIAFTTKSVYSSFTRLSITPEG